MSDFTPEEWAALQPLLDEMFELPPGARTEWLARKRMSHPQIAERLRELSDRDKRADAEGFLGTSPLTGMEPASSLAGQALGGYVLERELGHGGMGSVWLASRADGRFQGQAAIKFLSLAVAGAAGEARFRREGSVLARLTHPNIARLLDAGITGAGQPYLVLEYVDGQPIDRWCEGQRLDRDARIRLFLQVLAAVGQAHTNLVVHRDLKPGNILVTADGTVKLLDFGIAKLIEGEGPAPSQLTGSGEAVLTFEYAAPEQLQGEPITTQTDVYSLGVVLYQLVAGRHPTGANCTTPAEHIRATLETEPAWIPDAGDLDTVLAKALRKDPRERYATVAAFADDLSHYLNHEPVTARPDAWTYRARKFVRRHRGSVGTGILTVLALIGAAIVTTLQAREARRQRDIAFQEDHQQEASNSVRSILTTSVTGPEGQEPTRDQRVELALGVIERQYRDDPNLAAHAMLSLASSYLQAGQLAEGRALIARVQDMARREHLPGKLAVASCLRVTFWLYDQFPDSAGSDLAAARAALAELADPGIDETTFCLNAEGMLLAAQGKADSGVVLLRKSVAIRDATPGRTPAMAVNYLSFIADLASTLRAAGRTREAAKYQAQILAVLDSAGYANTGLPSTALTNLFSFLKELGEFAAAESAAAALARSQAASNGFGRPEALVAELLGATYLLLEQYDSADAWTTAALRDTSQVAHVWQVRYVPPVMSRLRLEQHRTGDAAPWINRIPNDTRGAMLYRTWFKAVQKYELGDRGGGTLALEAAVRQFQGDGPRPRPDQAPLLVQAAEWRLAAHEDPVADSLARRAIDAAAVDSLALSRSAYVGQADYVLARVRVRRGDAAGARTEAASAVTALANGFGPTHRRTMEARALLDSLKSN